VEYGLKIDAYTPDTMPMARLAEYMTELAALLGQTNSVHFARLEDGSTELVHWVEREASPKVRARTTGVKLGEAPQSAMRAYRTLNKFLREDDAVGTLREKTAATTNVVLLFPGRLEATEKIPIVRQQGSIDGIVNHMSGRDETVHVHLESDDKQVSVCTITRALAKQLRHHMWEPVRLFGRGTWSRDADGIWALKDFKIENFQTLQDEPLSAVLAKLREHPMDWIEDAYTELRRGDPAEKENGGH
jgi:hypothetical protein